MRLAETAWLRRGRRARRGRQARDRGGEEGGGDREGDALRDARGAEAEARRGAREQGRRRGQRGRRVQAGGGDARGGGGARHQGGGARARRGERAGARARTCGTPRRRAATPSSPPSATSASPRRTATKTKRWCSSTTARWRAAAAADEAGADGSARGEAAEVLEEGARAAASGSGGGGERGGERSRQETCDYLSSDERANAVGSCVVTQRKISERLHNDVTADTRAHGVPPAPAREPAPARRARRVLRRSRSPATCGRPRGWRRRGVARAGRRFRRSRPDADVTSASSSPVWVVEAPTGSNGDQCPVDAKTIMPACLAHPAGAVAAAHGGVRTSAWAGTTRDRRASHLDLDTGADSRPTLPMAWPDGGICPAARDARGRGGRPGGGLRRARLPRRRGPRRVPGIHRHARPGPAAARPHRRRAGRLLHAPAHGSDPGEARSRASPRGRDARAPARGADLAPFAGLHGAEIEDGSGNENVAARRARRRVSSRRRWRTWRGLQKSQRCSQWWHVSADLPPGVAPVAPETPGGHTAGRGASWRCPRSDGRRRDVLSAAASDPERGGFGVFARRGRRRARGRGLRVPTGCVWRFGTRDKPDGFAEQPRRRRRWSGAWRASAGAARPRCPRPQRAPLRGHQGTRAGRWSGPSSGPVRG